MPSFCSFCALIQGLDKDGVLEERDREKMAKHLRIDHHLEPFVIQK